FLATNVAASKRGAFRTAQIKGYSLHPQPSLDRLIVNLDAAHAENLISRKAAHTIADVHFSSQCRAGDDQAVTLQSKNAVDRETEVSWRLCFPACQEHLRNTVAEFLRSEERRVGKEGSGWWCRSR